MSIRRLSRLLSTLALALAMVALGAGVAGAQDPVPAQDPPAPAAEPSPYPPLPGDSGADVVSSTRSASSGSGGSKLTVVWSTHTWSRARREPRTSGRTTSTRAAVTRPRSTAAPGWSSWSASPGVGQRPSASTRFRSTGEERRFRARRSWAHHCRPAAFVSAGGTRPDSGTGPRSARRSTSSSERFQPRRHRQAVRPGRQARCGHRCILRTGRPLRPGAARSGRVRRGCRPAR